MIRKLYLELGELKVQVNVTGMQGNIVEIETAQAIELPMGVVLYKGAKGRCVQSALTSDAFLNDTKQPLK
jgi:hypothetical protein